MKYTIPLAFLLIMLSLGSSCGDDPVSPLLPDSTSQEFTFDVTYIDGDVNATLYDICRINDTCIWAVGWISRRDGTPYGVKYNAARWNGDEWLLEQVLDSMPGYSRAQVEPLDLVYGSSPDNIWFACGTLLVHWDGKKFSTVHHLSNEMKGGLKECWASGPDNIWMGGMNGELVHFNGRIWRRIKNDIEYEITGIWGQGDTVLIAATENPVRTRTKFYTVVNEEVRFLMEDSSVVQVEAVWYEHLRNILAEGPWSYHYDGTSWSVVDRPKAGQVLDVFGINKQDIVACGNFGTIRHWNGKRWKIWWKQPPVGNASLRSITMHGNTHWAVGGTNGKRAVIVTGRRPG